MKIIIFEDSVLLIKGFRKFGFEPMIDGIHGKDKNWLQQKLQCPHRLFYKDYLQTQFLSDTVDKLQIDPSFVVYFNDDQLITNFEWEQITKFVNSIMLQQPMSDRTERCIQRLLKQMTTKNLQSDIASEDSTKGLPQYYQFRSMVHEESDKAFFEIIKSNSTTPYTTIINDYSKVGYKPLFTNYISIDSFKNDCIAVHFLGKLWERFMDGPFDLDGLLKEATEQCYPSENFIPNAEPKVYARTIEQVMEHQVYRTK